MSSSEDKPILLTYDEFCLIQDCFLDEVEYKCLLLGTDLNLILKYKIDVLIRRLVLENKFYKGNPDKRVREFTVFQMQNFNENRSLLYDEYLYNFYKKLQHKRPENYSCFDEISNFLG